jgi:hypothetical protein
MEVAQMTARLLAEIRTSLEEMREERRLTKEK